MIHHLPHWRSKLHLRPLAAWVALVLVSPQLCYANPVGGVVSAGSASITSAGNTLTVNQASQRTVIDWRGFDIAPGETTRFVQPSSSAIALNRVNSTSASRIDGNLTANGNILIINQNGVLFGSHATVDVNGLIASSADIANDRFLNDTTLHLNIPGNPHAVIGNAGRITARDAGLVGFVAPNVLNSGIITANLGRVQLASGDTATVDMYGDGLMQVALSDDVTSQLVSNTGALVARGGTVALTAAAGSKMVNSLVHVQGELRAPSFAQRNGKIIIAAEGSNAVSGNNSADKGKKSGSSHVLVQAYLDTSGRGDGERGGDITVTGDGIALLDGTLIDASGHTGTIGSYANISDTRPGAAGGDIKIGGDYLGQGSTATARTLYVDPGVLVLNDALTTGDAGRSIFWSDDTTRFYGNVYARALGGKSVDPFTWHATAGGNAGNGGFVETSGHRHLDAGGYVNLTASNGAQGTYFLDPTDITILGNFDPTDIAGLSLWLDPSDSSTVFSDTAGTTGAVNNGAVARWNDKSGNGNYVTAAPSQEPIWQTNSINSLATLSFDGSTRSMSRNNVVGGATASTFFSAWAPNDTQYNLFLANNVDSYYRFGDTNGYFGMFRNARVNAYPSNMPSAGVHLLSLISSTTTYNAYLDSVDKGAQAADYTAGDQITIGVGPVAGYYTGNLMDMIVYQSALSTGNRQAVEQYLGVKWGITLTPPGTSGAGGTEALKAMASTARAGDTVDGYSSFTTRYLEYLSQNANIDLKASNNISLDLQGDTLNISTANTSITLNATNQITTASAGNITTNNGAISLTGSNGILLNHAMGLTSGGGNITLSNATTLGANLTTNSGSGTTTFSSTVDGAYNLNATAGTFSFGGALGGTTPLSAVTINSTNSLTLPAISAASISATTSGGAANITLPNGGNLTTTGASGITLTAGNDILTSGTGTAQSAATGNIYFNAARHIYFTHDYDLTALGSGDIRLQADDSIYSVSSGDMTTNGGDIIINSDHATSLGASNQSGSITLGSGTQLASNGGDIILGGGFDPTTEYAHGIMNPATIPQSTTGVSLATVTLDTGSSSGAIYISGKNPNTTTTASFGVNMSGSTITSAGNTIFRGISQGRSSSRGLFLHSSTLNIGNKLTLDAEFRNATGATGTSSALALVGTTAGTPFVINAGAGGVEINALRTQFTGTSQVMTTDFTNITSQGVIDIDATHQGTSNTRNGWSVQSATNLLTSNNAGIIIRADAANDGLRLTSAGASLTLGGAGNVGDIELRSDFINNLGTITTTTNQDAIFKPFSQTGTMGIAGATGSLQLTSGVLNAITANNVFLGRSDGQGLLRFSGIDLSSKNYNLSLLNGSSNIQFDGGGTALTLGANKSLSIATASGSFATATSSGTMATTGTGGITIDDAVAMGANLTLTTGNAGTLSFNAAVDGLYDLSATAGTFTFGGDIGGTTPLAAVSLTSTNSMTLPSINATSILARSTGAAADVTIPVGKALTASGTNTALTVAAGRNFINNAGAGALSASNGRWLVYATDPTGSVGEQTLSNAFNRYNCTYSGGCSGSVTIPATGNGLIYSYAPSLDVTITDPAYRYGDAVGTPTAYVLDTTDFLNALDLANHSFTGTPTFQTTYTLGTNAGVAYTVSNNAGTLASNQGYSLNYIDANGTVATAPLTVTADNASRVAGFANPTFTASYSGFQFADNASVLSGLTLATAANTGSPAGSYAITPSGATAANYTLSYVDGVLTVTAAPAATTTVLPNTVTRVSQTPVINVALQNTPSPTSTTESYGSESSDLDETDAPAAGSATGGKKKPDAKNTANSLNARNTHRSTLAIDPALAKIIGQQQSQQIEF